MMGKRILALAIALLALASAVAEGATFRHRYADPGEAAALLLSNRDYYEGLNQSDLSFRLQKADATLEEMESFAAAQALEFSDDEKALLDGVLSEVEQICAERGYALPAVDDIVFAKTTAREECGTAGYTHGTQIYLGEEFMDYALSGEEGSEDLFREVVVHELFHCLTRSHPDFRRKMYGLLGFTVEAEDYVLPESVADRIISNPDVEHHDAHAAFEIDGVMRECVVVFTTVRPFERPGDSFFELRQTGLVPIDDLSVLYTDEDAANFWEVFGENTDYVIDPEETLADDFCFAVLYGPDGMEYQTPALIRDIDALLRAGAWEAAA